MCVHVCECKCDDVSLSLSQMKASIKLVKELLNHYSVQSTLLGVIAILMIVGRYAGWQALDVVEECVVV